MKQAQKALKVPQITTIWPLNDRGNINTTIIKIKDKLAVYNVISDKEKAFLEKHKKFAK